MNCSDERLHAAVSASLQQPDGKLPFGSRQRRNCGRAITVLSLVLGLAAMVSWTTNVAEVAPAIATLGRPRRRFRVPIDEWTVGLGLALRAFPMLITEFRLLYAARRL
jgi:hypothetical protein